MSKRKEEQAKLLAGFINGVAGTMVSVGAIAPFAAYLYGLTPQPIVFESLFAGAAGFLTVGFVLPLVAQAVLKTLPN